MQKITVSPSPGQPYTCTVIVGINTINDISSLFDLQHYSTLFIVTDEAVAPLFLDTLLSVLPSEAASMILPPGEQHKHIETVQNIWTAMHEAACDRQSLVINLGGGVIGDLGGFAAATYMRGIDFINIPTTLLAQVDASIGGKTGFNFAGIKNLIGSLQQPLSVIIDPQTLTNLPEREFLSGFAEIIKHGLIADSQFFEQVTSKPPLEFNVEEMADIIAQSCRIKAKVVSEDETEQGSRKLLNFGHTIGHAVEALSFETGTPLLHGEAISLGMLAEADISLRQDLLSSADFERIKQALTTAGLATAVINMPVERILEKMQSDKKNDHGQVNFTLLEGVGQTSYNNHVPPSVVTEAIQAIIS